MNIQPLSSAFAITAGLVLAAIGATGCAGTETGNPIQVELRADAHSSDEAAVSVGDGGAVVVTGAWLALDPIGLASAPDCESGDPGGDAPDFGTADHAAPGAVLEEFEIEEGDYCGAVLPFVRAAAPLPAGAPPELEGSSVVITGEVPASGTPFRLVWTAERTIEVRGDDFPLGPDEPALFLGFDVARWLLSIDFAAADLEDGVAVIDADSNPDLLDAFAGDLAAGIELYRDLDRDGSVDAPDDELLAGGQ